MLERCLRCLYNTFNIVPMCWSYYMWSEGHASQCQISLCSSSRRKKGVYITKPPFKCSHTFFGCVCEASTRAFEIYCSHFYNYIVYVYFTLYFVSLIDTDTSPSFVRRAELRGNAHVFFLFLVVFHGILFGFASFLQAFISFFLILFGFFLLHSYNLFVLLYKLLLCKK